MTEDEWAELRREVEADGSERERVLVDYILSLRAALARTTSDNGDPVPPT